MTLPEESIVPLPAMWERVQDQPDVRDEIFAGGSGRLLYEILDRCVDAGFPMLGQLGRKLRRLEDDIFEGRSREIVREHQQHQAGDHQLPRHDPPAAGVFRALERAKQGYFGDELDVYFDDLTDASERIWDVLENFKEIAEALESSNESVLSHRLNDSLRILTAASVVLLPLTLIASVWGMNVPVPGEGAPAILLAHHRGYGHPAGRDGPLLPPARLALASIASVLDRRPIRRGRRRAHPPDRARQRAAPAAGARLSEQRRRLERHCTPARRGSGHGGARHGRLRRNRRGSLDGR